MRKKRNRSAYSMGADKATVSGPRKGPRGANNGPAHGRSSGAAFGALPLSAALCVSDVDTGWAPGGQRRPA